MHRSRRVNECIVVASFSVVVGLVASLFLGFGFLHFHRLAFFIWRVWHLASISFNLVALHSSPPPIHLRHRFIYFHAFISLRHLWFWFWPSIDLSSGRVVVSAFLGFRRLCQLLRLSHPGFGGFLISAALVVVLSFALVFVVILRG